MSEGEVIVLYKSSAALAEDMRAIMSKFDHRWAAIMRDEELSKVELQAKVMELAKSAGPAAATEVELVHRIAHLETLVKIRDAIVAFNSEYAEHNRLAKRSDRFRRQLSEQR